MSSDSPTLCRGQVKGEPATIHVIVTHQSQSRREPGRRFLQALHELAREGDIFSMGPNGFIPWITRHLPQKHSLHQFTRVQQGRLAWRHHSESSVTKGFASRKLSSICFRREFHSKSVVNNRVAVLYASLTGRLLPRSRMLKQELFLLTSRSCLQALACRLTTF